MLYLHNSLPLNYNTGWAFQSMVELENHLRENPESPVWITTENTLVAFRNPNPIEGVFNQQLWTGPKNDTLMHCKAVRFDATHYVLHDFGLQAIHGLKDSDDTSDDVGLAHVDWNGPHDVEVVDSILDYFGADKLCDITLAHLECARMSFTQNHPALAQELAAKQAVQEAQAQLELAKLGAELHTGEQAFDEFRACTDSVFEPDVCASVSFLQEEANGKKSFFSLQDEADKKAFHNAVRTRYAEFIKRYPKAEMVMMEASTASGDHWRATYMPKAQVLTFVDLAERARLAEKLRTGQGNPNNSSH